MNTKTSWVPLTAMFLVASAQAETQCVGIKDDLKRLACYDAANNLQKVTAQLQSTALAEQTGEKKSRPAWMDKFTVRDQGLPKSEPIAGPAIIGFVKDHDIESSVIKVSAIYSGDPFTPSGSGWYPYAAISIDRDLAASTPRNVWSAQIGTNGTILDYTKQGVALNSSFTAGRKEDTQAKTASNQAVFNNEFIIRGLATGESWSTKENSFQLIPSLGLSYEDLQKVKSGNSTGSYTSIYGALNLAYWPTTISERIKISARAQRFIDLDASSNLSERDINYYSLGIDYYLYNPKDEKPLSTPILGISREVGTDPINSIIDADRTLVSFKFKLN